MMNLSLSLFILYGFLLLSLSKELTNSEDFCTAVAVILHFSLFSSLSWMMAEAIYLIIATVKVRDKRAYMLEISGYVSVT